MSAVAWLTSRCSTESGSPALPRLIGRNTPTRCTRRAKASTSPRATEDLPVCPSGEVTYTLVVICSPASGRWARVPGGAWVGAGCCVGGCRVGTGCGPVVRRVHAGGPRTRTGPVRGCAPGRTVPAAHAARVDRRSQSRRVWACLPPAVSPATRPRTGAAHVSPAPGPVLHTCLRHFLCLEVIVECFQRLKVPQTIVCRVGGRGGDPPPGHVVWRGGN